MTDEAGMMTAVGSLDAAEDKIHQLVKRLRDQGADAATLKLAKDALDDIADARFWLEAKPDTR